MNAGIEQTQQEAVGFYWAQVSRVKSGYFFLGEEEGDEKVKGKVGQYFGEETDE